MINKTTAWKDTYRARHISASRAARISVVGAIHHNSTDDSLYLVSDLDISFEEGRNTCRSTIELTAAQMDLLGAHLIEMAAYQRELEAKLADHDSEERAAEFVFSLDPEAA